MGKKKGRRNRAREQEEEDSGSSGGRSTKLYFTLVNGTASNPKKYAVPSGHSVQESAFVAAKKAWRDNKLLNKVSVQEMSSQEVFHFAVINNNFFFLLFFVGFVLCKGKKVSDVRCGDIWKFRQFRFFSSNFFLHLVW